VDPFDVKGIAARIDTILQESSAYRNDLKMRARHLGESRSLAARAENILGWLNKIRVNHAGRAA